MAGAQKLYRQNAVLLYNLACDIVEMYKAKITQDDVARFAFDTAMYGQKTHYLFRIETQPDGCLLSIETEGEDESAERRVSFMFSVVDNMLAQYRESR
ncbi:MAG: hypothetical protein LBL15_05320 [Oscillospiraceae bacterium]|jgi:hypothetical protein|nr:hypothetical protein [Oscillospiraceae bacterium]